MKKTQNHWRISFSGRVDYYFFLYTIRNNYSRRRRHTHPFLKVFIIKSSWDQWFQLDYTLATLDPNQIDVYASTSSYEIHFLGHEPAATPEEVEKERGISDGL